MVTTHVLRRTPVSESPFPAQRPVTPAARHDWAAPSCPPLSASVEVVGVACCPAREATEAHLLPVVRARCPEELACRHPAAALRPDSGEWVVHPAQRLAHLQNINWTAVASSTNVARTRRGCVEHVSIRCYPRTSPASPTCSPLAQCCRHTVIEYMLRSGTNARQWPHAVLRHLPST